jgi:capsular polysaccharide biosynthesis protein
MEDKMEETISLQELLQTLKSRMLLIISVTLVAVSVSGIISYFFLTPIYQASTQLLVNQTNNDQGQYNIGEVQTNLQLINTYNVIIKSPAILDKVNDELNLKMTTEELNKKISVESAQNSQVVTISVDDPKASEAAKIANKTAEVFKSQIVNIMKVDNVSILAKAKVIDGQSPIKPRPLLNVAIALVVGLMAGVGLAFLLEYFNNTIKTEQDIEKILGLPVLGVITNIGEVKASDKNITRTTRMRGETLGS